MTTLLVVGLLVALLGRSYVISDHLLALRGRPSYYGNATASALLTMAGAIMAGTAIGGLLA